MKFNILKIYFMDNVHNIYPLFKTQITPKFYLIIYYIFIYFGVYSIYTLFIQSIGSEIGFNLIDSQFSYYSTSAGITVPRVIDSLNSKNLIDDSVNKIDDSILSPKVLNKSKSLNRKDILNEGSEFSLKIRKIINMVKNNEISSLEGQIKLEEICISQETMFFNNLISSLDDKDSSTNFLRLKLVNDWEYKLNNALFKYLQPYIINNYKKLEKEINRISGSSSYVSFVLLILSLNGNVNIKNNKSNKVISLMMTIIMRLLVINNDLGGGEIKKVNLVMELANNLISRAPTKIPSELKLDHLQDYYYNEILNNIAEETKASIGTALLDLVLENVDILIEKDTIYDYIEKKNYKIISIKHDYRDELLRRSISTVMLPMIVKPLDWKINDINYNLSKNQSQDLVGGGYLTQEMKRIVNKYNTFIKQSYKNENKSVVGSIQVDTINYLNKQKFRINKEMLEFLLLEFYSGVDSIIFKNKNRLHPLTEKLSKLDIDKNVDVKKEILSHNSLYYLYRNILGLAVIFEDITFYLPTFMDFRGRIYSYVHYLNYQGTDIARSLFEFVEGCILNKNNINVVYHYFANTAGKKKLTIKNKIQWSKKFIDDLVNEYMILDKSFLNDDFNYKISDQVKNIVKICDEPAQFMSVYFSLIKYLRDPNLTYHTPVLFDATCSGMQHLSALFSDIKLGELSNVIGNDEEIPQDVYTNISISVKEYIQNIEDESLRNIFNKINITRQLMKRPVMTIPYNVSLNSMQEQLIQDGFFIKKFESLTVNKGFSYTVNPNIVVNNEELILNSTNMGKFSVILYYSVFNRFPSLQIFKKYLDDLINVLLKINKPIVWTTPSGMTISLSNRKFKKYESKSLFIKKRSVTISLPTTSLDTRQIKIAFMPNFIHSMDASNIHLLIKRLIEISDNTINLYTIHDCFASTPNFMNTINNEVKLAFIELYLNFDYLESMHNIILSQIKSYTTVYTQEYKKCDFKNKNNYLPRGIEVSLDEKSYFNYIILDNKKIIIPNKPNLYDWNKNRKIFIEGIKKSIYFIN